VQAAAEINKSADGKLVKHSELQPTTESLSGQVNELDKALEAKKLENNLSEDERDREILDALAKNAVVLSLSYFQDKDRHVGR
jgi:hypothetical protein